LLEPKENGLGNGDEYSFNPVGKATVHRNKDNVDKQVHLRISKGVVRGDDCGGQGGFGGKGNGSQL